VQATSGLLPWVQKPDSLLLPSGTTYRYTMDTPEGEGLVPTLFSVNELLERFAETNGVPCRLVDSRGMQKTVIVWNCFLRKGRAFADGR